MSKLHEVIAVEPDLKQKARKILKESLNVFSKKHGLFQGQYRHYKPIDDDGLALPPESSELTTTVDNRLEYTLKTVFDYIDVMASKDRTNTVATGDVIIDGKTILKDIPAVTLLSLEQEFTELRKVYDLIPTLDLSEKWTIDKALGHYVSEERETFKTEKTYHNHVKYEATKEHPAQVEIISKDIPIGRWFTKKFSGMKTPQEKHDLLVKVDKLIRAFKEARQRANQKDVVELKISKELTNFINS